MLSVKSYDADYVAICGKRLAAALAVVPEDPHALNELVVSLDASFVHRMRGQEGKDGNPLNEVRILASAILTNGAVFTSEPTIKYDPEKSITRLDYGDSILIDKATFQRLSDAVLAEIAKRYP